MAGDVDRGQDAALSGDETVGHMVDEAQSAHPGSIYRDGMRITYIGEVQLEAPPDVEYHVPFPGQWLM